MEDGDPGPEVVRPRHRSRHGIDHAEPVEEVMSLFRRLCHSQLGIERWTDPIGEQETVERGRSSGAVGSGRRRRPWEIVVLSPLSERPRCSVLSGRDRGNGCPEDLPPVLWSRSFASRSSNVKAIEGPSRTHETVGEIDRYLVGLPHRCCGPADH